MQSIHFFKRNDRYNRRQTCCKREIIVELNVCYQHTRGRTDRMGITLTRACSFGGSIAILESTITFSCDDGMLLMGIKHIHSMISIFSNFLALSPNLISLTWWNSLRTLAKYDPFNESVNISYRNVQHKMYAHGFLWIAARIPRRLVADSRSYDIDSFFRLAGWLDSVVWIFSPLSQKCFS